MLTRLAKARSSIQIFFPIEPLPESPYAMAGRSWQTSSGQPDIRQEFVELLQCDPEIVEGYSLLPTQGAWFNDDTDAWESDEVCMIITYVYPNFVAEYRDPTQPKSRPRKFLARIGQLSCDGMGHACFWCILDGKSLEKISKDGMEVADGTTLSFDHVLN